MKCGGCALARQIHKIILRAIVSGTFHIAWKGGYISNLFKNKGDPAVCDNSRGLLVSDHAGKVLTQLLQDAVHPSYARAVGSQQFGAMPGRGTSLASHCVRSFLDACRLLRLSVCVILIDLSKAYDLAIRELLMGWFDQSHMTNIEYLQSLGIPSEAATAIAEYIDSKGPLFAQLLIDPKVWELIHSLHQGAWFQVPGTDRFIIPRTGGRQGCKLAGVIFSMIYSIAMRSLVQHASDLGLVMTLQQSSRQFWSASKCPPMHEPNYIQASDVEFVDDAALLLSARSPSKLMKAMPKLLSDILSVFQRFSFHVNWAKGKTEAFLSLRGKNAHILMQDTISNESSMLVPNSGERLRVVSEYKHLGTVLSFDGSDNLDTVRRVQLSLAAYCPLASKVFGSFSVKICLKLKLADSLVFSRLFYNTHLYARLSKFVMAKLNSVYMRVLRKVLGRPPRFQDRSLNDEQVRAALHMPCVSLYLGCVVLSIWRRL